LTGTASINSAIAKTKTMTKLSSFRVGAALCALALARDPLGWSLSPQQVSLHVHVTRQQGQGAGAQPSSADVVVWLTPTQRSPLPPVAHTGQPFILAQKDKQFTPHILVVPTGSYVEFPNLDPFFHNVFSLFNGKRFDLGLYEAHTQRSVLFDRDGVSYIFCNIHPEMGAVVISLSTPYYGVSSRDGSIILHDVPPGRYRLHVWAENVPVDRLDALSRIVETAGQNTDLGVLSLQVTGSLMKHHANKFGESYTPVPKDPY
jgi:plastocyanin